jgi:squalene-hopene/tetraprenyl-beta-curcumene cyclase
MGTSIRLLEGYVAMRHRFACYCFGVTLIATLASAEPKGNDQGSSPHDWDRFTAAHYLDERQIWWMNWPKAQRDHETACVSCHTAVPYALARPSLRHGLGESGPSNPEQTMLGYVTRRVNLWNEVEPFYSDEKVGPRKTVESRGTESVLNALILARYDAQQGRLSDVTRKAFDNMWATQLTKGAELGAWDWLNFHNAPWESNESQYYGATLAALAVGLAPGNYRKSPEIQPELHQLSSYLMRDYAAQPLVNRIVLLWASSQLPRLLTSQQRKSLMDEIRARQGDDGGWSLTKLGEWKRKDNTALDERSDGYATGLTVYALKEAGVSTNKPEMKQAIMWLIKNQNAKEGLWQAYSLNKQRDAGSEVGHFMNDAATSYSVMALEAVHR